MNTRRTEISSRTGSSARTRIGAGTRISARNGIGAVAVLAAGMFLLTGCKSANSQGDNPAPSAPPAAPGAPSGSGAASAGPAGSADFSYGGAENNSAHIGSSACVVSNGNVVSFRTPASGAAATLSGAKSGQSWTVSLATATHSTGYTGNGSTEVTTSDDGGVWTVSLSGVTLTSGSSSVTLSGTVLCGRGA